MLRMVSDIIYDTFVVRVITLIVCFCRILNWTWSKKLFDGLEGRIRWCHRGRWQVQNRQVFLAQSHPSWAVKDKWLWRGPNNQSMHERSVDLGQANWLCWQSHIEAFQMPSCRQRRYWSLQRGSEPWHSYFLTGAPFELVLRVQFDGHDRWASSSELIFDRQSIEEHTGAKWTTQQQCSYEPKQHGRQW